MNNPKLIRARMGASFVCDITLLDLFAGIAFHALLQMSENKDFQGKVEERAKNHGMTPEAYLAKDSYIWGMHLLEQREEILKKGESDAEKTD